MLREVLQRDGSVQRAEGLGATGWDPAPHRPRGSARAQLSGGWAAAPPPPPSPQSPAHARLPFLSACGSAPLPKPAVV